MGSVVKARRGRGCSVDVVAFTVDADKAILGPVLHGLVCARKALALADGFAALATAGKALAWSALPLGGARGLPLFIAPHTSLLPRPMEGPFALLVALYPVFQIGDFFVPIFQFRLQGLLLLDD